MRLLQVRQGKPKSLYEIWKHNKIMFLNLKVISFTMKKYAKNTILEIDSDKDYLKLLVQIVSWKSLEMRVIFVQQDQEW